MKALNKLLGLTYLALYRLRNQPVLNFCLVVGLAAAVALLTSVPLYAEAIHNRLLQGQLTEAGTTLPPFSFVWRYVGSWQADITRDQYAAVDGFLQGQAVELLELPLENSVRHVQTMRLQLFPEVGEGRAGNFRSNEPLLWVSTGFLSHLPDQARLLEGQWPTEPVAGGAAPVVVSRVLAEQLGVQVGERYLLFVPDSEGEQIALEISGVWQPRDPADSYWFYRPDAFDEVLLTSEAAFEQVIVPQLAAPISLAIWYHRFDGSRVRTDDVEPLLGQVQLAEARASALLPGVTLSVSPVVWLHRYQQDARQLTLLLTAFSLPVLGLILYFITLLAGLLVDRGQQEIALLRSRGSSYQQILLLYLVQGVLLGGAGLLGGVFLGPLVATLMGQTRSFLQLDLAAAPLPVVFSATSWQYALSGLALALLALLLPALRASQQNIVSARQNSGREKRPFWQRIYLDILLLLPLVYGWYLLEQQGMIVRAAEESFLSNPLLFLIPALFCVTGALLLVRLFALASGLLAGVAARLPVVVPLLVLRSLSRRPGGYTGPLLLICMTLALSVFAASAASTLDEHLVSQTYYRVGADVNLAEIGTLATSAEPSEGSGGGPAGKNGPGSYRFLPVAEHLRLDGVNAAVRVSDLTALAQLGGRQRTGRLLGIDRLEFPEVAFFRPDFAGGESLGSLMNRLGAGWNHLLVSRYFLAENNLAVGDPLPLTLSLEGQAVTVPFIIAGAVELFPTYDPADGPLFIANLDYIHERLGGLYHYNVWLSTESQVPANQIMEQARGLGIGVLLADDARTLILKAQTRPERQGLFGLLSAGFVAAGILTVLGYLVYAVAGFKARMVEAGLLRAIGISVTQLTLTLVTEQALLIGAGVSSGISAGLAASYLFLPYLQIGPAVPAFAVQIDWDGMMVLNIYVVSLLIAVIVILVGLLLRMKLFVAVKLGETV